MQLIDFTIISELSHFSWIKSTWQNSKNEFIKVKMIEIIEGTIKIGSTEVCSYISAILFFFSGHT